MNHQKVVITGATKGIGEAVSLWAAENGMQVLAVARTKADLESLKEKNPDKISIFPCDISNRAEVEAAHAEMVKTVGDPDLLINNAGIVYSSAFLEQPLDYIDNTIDINLKGSMYWTRLVLPAMVKQKWGRVINISSVAGVRGIPNQSSYCTSKWGLTGFGEALAQEMLEHGVHINTICPGAVDTPLWNPKHPYFFGDKTKIIKPKEIVDMIEFLLKQPDTTFHKRMVLFPAHEWH